LRLATASRNSLNTPPILRSCFSGAIRSDLNEDLGYVTKAKQAQLQFCEFLNLGCLGLVKD
jgi:hypothetical protein